MKLLDKLEALFVNQPKRKMDEHPGLFDRLRECLLWRRVTEGGSTTLIEDFAVRLGATVEQLRSHTAEFEANCSNDALQRLKESSSEIEKYSTEFFWSLMHQDRDQKAGAFSQRTGA